MSNTSHILTGFTALDTLIDGLRPGITTIASRASMGKSVLAYTILEFASRAGLQGETSSAAHTLVFSNESSSEKISQSVLAIKSAVPRKIIAQGALTDGQKEQLVHAQAEMDAQNKIVFLPDVELDLASIRRQIEERKASNSINLVILDGPNAKDFRLNPDLMTELQELATTHELPILMTHDLDSLYLDQREDKRPTIFDFSGTPAIAQKSQVILVLYRDAFYNRETDNPHGAEIIVVKNDYGETGTIPVRFMPDISRFEDVKIAE